MVHSFLVYIKRLPLLYSISGGVVLVAIVAIGIHFATRGAAPLTVALEYAHVRVASVASLSSATGPLPVTGKVTSLSHATILAQSSGEIVSLSHKIGDSVGAGSVLASFESSSQQALVLQAQGSYEAAQAALAKASGSTAANSSITSSQATQGVQNAQTAVVTTLLGAYAALDDAVHAKADTLFTNPRSASPILISLTIPDSQLVINVQNERSQLEQVLTHANAHTSGDTIDANVGAMSADAQVVLSFLTDLIKAISEAIPNQNTSAATIAASGASAAAARSEVLAAMTALSTAKSAYDSARTNAQTSANSAQSGTTNDIAAATAQVKIALGALNNARAGLEKTVIRSPISGTIVSLAITRGDFVPTFSQVAEVSNPGALEVDTYVTSDDAKTLAVGGKARIDGRVPGIITSVASALDPTTGKIPVKVGIVGDQTVLTDGETITVSLNRTTESSVKNTSTTILIPIVAVKITPQGPVVFKVSSNLPAGARTLVSVPVVLGAILGSQVTVTSGITQESDIITDARGHSSGEVVIVDTQ